MKLELLGTILTAHISKGIVSEGLFVIKSSDRNTSAGKYLYEATKVKKNW